MRNFEYNIAHGSIPFRSSRINLLTCAELALPPLKRSNKVLEKGDAAICVYFFEFRTLGRLCLFPQMALAVSHSNMLLRKKLFWGLLPQSNSGHQRVNIVGRIFPFSLVHRHPLHEIQGIHKISVQLIPAFLFKKKTRRSPFYMIVRSSLIAEDA